MEDNSELHPGSLRIQCNKAIEVIDKENEAYEELISKLRTNIVENETMSGETADSIKAYASDLIFVVEYAIEANELDKVDHQTLLNEIDSVLADKVDVNEVLRGYEIHTNIINIENRINEYDRLVELYNPAGEGLIMSLFYENKQEEYKDQIKDLERELEDWKYKEERYDIIESETSGLFSNTSEIRKFISDTILEMNNSVVDYDYKTSDFSNSRGKIELMISFPEVYSHLKELRDEKNNLLYTEEQIVGFWIDFKENNTDTYIKMEYLKKTHTEYYISYLDNLDNLIEKYVLVPWYYNVMELDGEDSAEICLKSYFEKKDIDWTQEKINEVWYSCRQIYDEYKINIDPRILLAIIIQEGNGSFNTSSVNKAADGQNGYEEDFATDLFKANDLIFGKFIGYLCYGDKFEECVNSNDVLKEQNAGGIFDYFNWNTPIVKPWDGVIYSGVYANHSAWGNNVEKIYEDLAYEGASKDYSEYVSSINKINELIGDMKIVDYSFEVVNEGQDSNGDNKTLIVKGTPLNSYLY